MLPVIVALSQQEASLPLSLAFPRDQKPASERKKQSASSNVANIKIFINSLSVSKANLTNGQRDSN